MGAAASPLVVVLGPTGSGKSLLALELASQFQGEIVSCDSLQVYRGFDVGTAKLTESEWRGIPHHLIDIAEPTELFTAGDYARRARAVLTDITARKRLPVVAGGTGFYLRALIDGLFSGPERDEGLRARLAACETRHPGVLHRFLRRFDPATAGRIHVRDTQKLIRAVEVCLVGQKPASAQFRSGRNALTGYRILKIGLNPPRPELVRRLDDRCRRMFEGGLLDEVRSLLSSGVPRTARPFESLGYKEALAVVEGRMTVEEAVAGAQTETRQYAKRQMTWFRREKDVCWLEGFGSDPAIQAAASGIVKAR